jgi:alpha-tubulin suppressor-like RCC1 family protein
LNDNGQLGIGNTTNTNIPTKVSLNLNTSEVITVLSVGLAHNLFLTNQGRVFSWGWGGLYQLGFGDTSNRYVPTEISPSLFNYKAVAKITAGVDCTHFLCMYSAF